MSNVDMRTSPATPSGTFGTILRCVEVPGIRAAEAVYPKVRSLPLHEHEHPFVTYVLSGEYAEMAGSSTRECARGSVVFHPGPEAHENRVGSSDVCCFNVELTTDLWTSLIGRTRTGRSIPGLAFSGDVEWPAFRLWREFHRPDAASPLAIEESLVALVSEVSEVRDRLNVSRGRWIDRAAEYVAAHLDPSPRLRDVARVVGVHPMHLARAFRRRYGCSMGEFARRRRIARACAQLQRDDGTISTIAIGSGFADHAHFTRTFRRITGCTPSWYRQRLRPARTVTSSCAPS